ncbi:uncharacterized protein A1O9_03635, partial [Exophiala aquamarina CBS 119918]
MPDDVQASGHPLIGVISWGKANLSGRGLDGDMANLIGDLEVHRVVADHHRQVGLLRLSQEVPYDFDFYHQALKVLTESMIIAYKSHSNWLRKLPKCSKINKHFIAQPQDSDRIRRRRGYSTSLLLLERSAFLTVGFRLLESVFENTFLCLDPICRLPDGAHAPRQYNCAVVQKMLERGFWYLSKARNNYDEFSQASNRMAIRNAWLWDGGRGQARPWLPLLFARSD